MTTVDDVLRTREELRRQRREAWKEALLDAGGLVALFAAIVLVSWLMEGGRR